MYDDYDDSQSLPPFTVSDVSFVCTNIPNSECVPLNRLSLYCLFYLYLPIFIYLKKYPKPLPPMT